MVGPVVPLQLTPRPTVQAAVMVIVLQPMNYVVVRVVAVVGQVVKHQAQAVAVVRVVAMVVAEAGVEAQQMLVTVGRVVTGALVSSP
jgi:hypothetical protein